MGIIIVVFTRLYLFFEKGTENWFLKATRRRTNNFDVIDKKSVWEF